MKIVETKKKFYVQMLDKDNGEWNDVYFMDRYLKYDNMEDCVGCIGTLIMIPGHSLLLYRIREEINNIYDPYQQ